MVNLIYQKNGKGPKYAHVIEKREDLIAACNTPENIENSNKYRETGFCLGALGFLSTGFSAVSTGVSTTVASSTGASLMMFSFSSIAEIVVLLYPFTFQIAATEEVKLLITNKNR